MLAASYQVGVELPKSLPRAAYWYKKSADNGDVRAYKKLAIMYKDGTGRGADYAGCADGVSKGAVHDG
ncbi:hypothetical protein NB640_11640 [Oxalobacter vibrioformis]|uniref:Sel1 repeat family protein n=1 Tax=Oxalobacter vibrioformis TaxID=933080 RepID=A0A9E9P491_9BURK|nr:hypothetical protein [Oxalobacter vibrioformis]WAW09856.1 hypothetical protein NB640_11640 [Oxalobacter vibrioformis]